jgi:hypothetical protein
MALLKWRLWLFSGPNLVSAGLYPLRGWWTLFVWFGSCHAIVVRMPVRYLMPTPTGRV